MVRMRSMIAAAAVLAALIVSDPRAASLQDSGARSPRNASYTLTARLDPAAHVIDASGKLRWKNISNNPASELRFHLYWNAWRDQNSTWLRELSQAGGSVFRPDEDLGSIDVSSLSIGGQNLIDRAQFIAPDDGNKDDRTVL